jgi:predicted metal-binding integral membrane protein DUF2182
MSAMGEMPMPGAAASFLGMWVVMMVAMMLPSLVPMLWRYHQTGLDRLTALVGVGYCRVVYLNFTRRGGSRRAAYSRNRSKRYASSGPLSPSYASCATSSANGSV